MVQVQGAEFGPRGKYATGKRVGPVPQAVVAEAQHQELRATNPDCLRRHAQLVIVRAKLLQRGGTLFRRFLSRWSLSSAGIPSKAPSMVLSVSLVFLSTRNVMEMYLLSRSSWMLFIHEEDVTAVVGNPIRNLIHAFI